MNKLGFEFLEKYDFENVKILSKELYEQEENKLAEKKAKIEAEEKAKMLAEKAKLEVEKKAKMLAEKAKLEAEKRLKC